MPSVRRPCSIAPSTVDNSPLATNFALLVALLTSTAKLGCASDNLGHLSADARQDSGTASTGGDAAPTPQAESTDGTVAAGCIVAGPTPESQQLGRCCHRSPYSKQRSAPQFRVAGLQIDAPASLTSLITHALLANAIDQERFNWLIALSPGDAEGEVSVRIGAGRRQSDGAFTFSAVEQPLDYRPVELAGRVDGDLLTAGPVVGPVIIFIEREASEEIEVEIPIRQLEITRGQMSTDRTCIGKRITSTFDTSAGQLRGFVTWSDASVAMSGLGGIPSARLCTYLLGKLTGAPGSCSDIPKDEWTTPPDSLCDEQGCVEGGCDGLKECNAWRISARFAAQAVRIR